MDIKHILKDHAYQNIPLGFEEAHELGLYALTGCAGDRLAQIQSITALSALHTRATYAWVRDRAAEVRHGHPLPPDASEQIAGVCAAIFDEDIVRSEFGFLHPRVQYAMDNCGMGGDLVITANVSTIAAFIAAAADIPMCKHGSPANAGAGRHGSSDFVTMLGIRTFVDAASIESCVEQESFGYTEALDTRYKRIHLQTHEVAFIPHMNDIIGPITNPLSPKILRRRVLGVNHLVSPRIVAETYRLLNRRGITHLDHGVFVRGFADEDHWQGMDEVSICAGGTQVAELRDGYLCEYLLNASDFGLDPVPLALISPPSGMSKGDFSFAILRGEITGPPLEMVLANAAMIFYLAGRSSDLRECYRMAKAVHDSGAAYRKMLAVRERLPK